MPEKLAAAELPKPIREICDEHVGGWLLIKILDGDMPLETCAAS
jgi:hypothetical protein